MVEPINIIVIWLTSIDKLYRKLNRKESSIIVAKNQYEPFLQNWKAPKPDKKITINCIKHITIWNKIAYTEMCFVVPIIRKV